MRQLLLILIIIVILISPVSHAQDDGQWTCDWGDADIINAAFDEMDTGNFTRAFELAELASDVCSEHDDHLAFGFFIQATVLSREGRVDEALTLYAEAAEVFHEINDDYWEAYSLTEMGLVYQQQGQYSEALDAFEQSLDINQRIGEEQEVAFVLAGIGDIYLAEGDYEDALKAYEQSLEISRDIGYRTEEAYVLYQLGNLYSNQGDFTEALVHYDQALVGFQDVDDQIMSAITLNRMGVIYAFQENYPESFDHYNQALAIFQETGFSEWEATVLSNIADNFYSTVDYRNALDHYQQALAISQEIGDRAREGNNLASIGEVYYVQGQYEAALNYSEQSLVIRQEVGDSIGEGVSLSTIGDVYWRRSQYGQALDAYYQALDIYQENGDRAGEGSALFSIGRAYVPLGDYELALENLRDALGIYKEFDDLVAERFILNSIGVIYYAQDQFEEAFDILQQTLALSRKAGDRSSEAAALSNMGLTYYAQGQLDEALDYLQQSLDITREIEDHYGEATALNNLGFVYREEGQLDKALELTEQALAIGKETGDPNIEQRLLVSRAQIYERQGNVALAVEDYTRAVQLLDILTFDLSPGSIRESLFNETQDTSAYHALANLMTLQGNAELALFYAERAKTFSMRANLTSDAIDFQINSTPEMVNMEAELRINIVNAQALVNSLSQDSEADSQTMQDAHQVLDDALQVYFQHLKTMRIQGGYIERQLGQDVASLNEIQAVIPDDTSLLIYSVGPFNTVVFIVTADNLEAEILEVEQEAITEQIAMFESDRRASTEALSTLYDFLIAPIENQFRTSRLIIVPDGRLSHIPFAALQSPAGDYLIDNYAISRISSATTLVLLNDRELSDVAVNGAENLVLAQPSAPTLPTLQYATVEAQEVAAFLDTEANVDATETDLRTSATGSSVIYISAHAPLDPYAPLFSAIHLGEDDQHDGRFEIRDIYELDLRDGSDLVIVSGSATFAIGDGNDYGTMSRAFFGAGAPRVFAGLWNANDEAAGVLLTAFIEQRSNFDNDADAVQAAMLEVRDTYPEPYFWAGFVLSGLPQ